MHHQLKLHIHIFLVSSIISSVIDGIRIQDRGGEFLFFEYHENIILIPVKKNIIIQKFEVGNLKKRTAFFYDEINWTCSGMSKPPPTHGLHLPAKSRALPRNSS
jgi:hypothetical protein